MASDDNTAVSFNEGFGKYISDYKYVQGPVCFEGQIDFKYPTKVNETDRTGIDEAVEAAKSAEVVVMVWENMDSKVVKVEVELKLDYLVYS